MALELTNRKLRVRNHPNSSFVIGDVFEEIHHRSPELLLRSVKPGVDGFLLAPFPKVFDGVEVWRIRR